MERKRKRRATEDVDWNTYFYSIRSVCPWSWRSWQQGCITIQKYGGNILPLGDYHARVYIHHNASARLLKKIHDRLNSEYPEYEFLWSHPIYKHHSTPKPCFIQQDRAVLEGLRDKLNK